MSTLDRVGPDGPDGNLIELLDCTSAEEPG